MSSQRQTMIKEKIKDCMRAKLQVYKPEVRNMPFHHLLLGKDKIDLFSFIHSLNTKFGTLFYEPIAIALAKGRFKGTEAQVKPFDRMSIDAQQQIQTIMDELWVAERKPNRGIEVEEIRQVCQTGTLKRVKQAPVDIWLENYDGALFFIDLKPVKPSWNHIERYKRTLLEWTAAELARDPEVVVNTMIGIPYNPYEPKPYSRWTLRGMLDLDHEVLIAEELWDFLGGEGTYADLLDAFEQAGIELRSEIDSYFAQFK